MKPVSFKVAEAIKNAGYPQGKTNECYLTADTKQFFRFCKKGQIVDNRRHDWPADFTADIPTYIDVWLWLWREKGFRFELAHPEYKGEYDFDKLYCNITSGSVVTDDYSDPEEAIIAAIDAALEYLETHKQ